MARSRLELIRSVFESRINEADQFVQRCRQSRHGTTNRAALTRDQLEWSAELALLKLVLGSERFFEMALTFYVLGERSPKGYKPRRLKIVTSSVHGMLEVFRGDQAFVGWNSPDVIISRSERWLRGGEPFQTTLSGASQILNYLVKMRNVVAHESDTAFEKYQKATRALYGGMPKRICPGLQLSSPPPSAIPYLVGTSLFDSAIASYRLIARQIVP